MPQREFVWRDDQNDFAGLEWVDAEPCPTDAVITAWREELEAAWDYNEFQRLRAGAYPPIAEQLDALFHHGYEGWKAMVQAVKDEFPKPS